MCFSATASFTSAVVLSLTGTITLVINKDPRRMLISLPIIFGLQQTAEGVVWITNRQENQESWHLR